MIPQVGETYESTKLPIRFKIVGVEKSKEKYYQKDINLEQISQSVTKGIAGQNGWHGKVTDLIFSRIFIKVESIPTGRTGVEPEQLSLPKIGKPCKTYREKN